MGYNLTGQWFQGNFEIYIGMTGYNEFNVKAVTAELQRYFVSGYGEVFESGKFRMTLTTQLGQDAEHQGFVSADGRSMHFNNGSVWRRR